MKIYFFTVLSLLSLSVSAQIDSSLLKRALPDAASQKLNMDAVYNRPFLSSGKFPLSLGGYIETDWQRIETEGVSGGHQFEFRRLSIFVGSTITKKIKFLGELEFEDGAKEISVEYAAVDVEFHPMLSLRTGIILNPIGSFNQNHDGPKWEFIDRPKSSTKMLPATFNNAGFGFYGKNNSKSWMFGYEVYLTGGFDESIIDNDQDKTFLPEAKENAERFEHSESGMPMVTGKISLRNTKIAELGFSYMGGIYNKWELDGIQVAPKRRVDVYAIDMNTTLPFLKTNITAEWAWIFVEIPETVAEKFARHQQGGFADVVQPILKRKMFGWENSVLNLACRLEYVDWNYGTFRSSGDDMGNEYIGVVPAFSFRPSAQTVFRINYRMAQQSSLRRGRIAETTGFSVGFSSYF